MNDHQRLEFEMLQAAADSLSGSQVLFDWMRKNGMLEDLEDVLLNEDTEAIQAGCKLSINVDELVSRFRDGGYLGAWDNMEDWGASYWEDCGLLDKVPEHLRYYIDFTKWARDAELSGDVTEVIIGGYSHIFSNHW